VFEPDLRPFLISPSWMSSISITHMKMATTPEKQVGTDRDGPEHDAFGFD
jgi:hypothetical protein